MNEPGVVGGLVRRPIGPPPLALRVAAVLVIPLLLYVLVATGQKAIESYRLNRDADALRTEILTLRTENIELQKQIEQARTDTAIETIAREQLGLIKPGDHPLVLVAQSPQPATAPSPAAAPPPSPPPWRQWWDYLFG